MQEFSEYGSVPGRMAPNHIQIAPSVELFETSLEETESLIKTTKTRSIYVSPFLIQATIRKLIKTAQHG